MLTTLVLLSVASQIFLLLFGLPFAYLIRRSRDKNI